GAVPPTITAYAITGGQPQTLATTMFPMGMNPIAAWVVPPTSGSVPQLAVSRNDGYLVGYDGALAVSNAAPGRPGMFVPSYYAPGGWGALQTMPVVTSLDGGSVQRVLVPDSRGALVRLDADTASIASPPVTAWAKTRTQAPTVVPGIVGGQT